MAKLAASDFIAGRLAAKGPQFARGGHPSRRHIALRGLPRTSTPDDVRRLLQRHSIGNVTNVQLEYFNFYPTGTAILTLSGAQHYNDTMDQLQLRHRLYGHTLAAAPTPAPTMGHRPEGARPSLPTTPIEKSKPDESDTLPPPESVVGQLAENSSSATLGASESAGEGASTDVNGSTPARDDAQQDSVAKPDLTRPSHKLVRKELPAYPKQLEERHDRLGEKAEKAVASLGALIPEPERKEWTPGIWAGTGAQAGVAEVGRSVCILGLPVETSLSTMRTILESRGFTLDNERGHAGKRPSTGVWKVASPPHALSSRFLVKLPSETEAHRLVRDFHMTYHHRHLIQARVIV